MKRTVWLAIAFAIVVVAFVVVSTFQQDLVRCQVCITFNGRPDCRIASATSREGAIRAATTNACAQLASGVSETTQCEATQPDSVKWLR